MTIKGKNIGFVLTVGASMKLAKLCPNRDISQIDKLFGDNYLANLEGVVKFISIMSEGFRDYEAVEGRNADLLTEDMIMALKPDELTTLMKEAMKSFRADSKGEVEAETKKEVGEGM